MTIDARKDNVAIKKALQSNMVLDLSADGSNPRVLTRSASRYVAGCNASFVSFQKSVDSRCADRAVEIVPFNSVMIYQYEVANSHARKTLRNHTTDTAETDNSYPERFER
jgi:hypothetical protein